MQRFCTDRNCLCLFQHPNFLCIEHKVRRLSQHTSDTHLAGVACKEGFWHHSHSLLTITKTKRIALPLHLFIYIFFGLFFFYKISFFFLMHISLINLAMGGEQKYFDPKSRKKMKKIHHAFFYALLIWVSFQSEL